MSKYSAAWLLEIASYCAVNCYAIITGYNYYGRKVDLSKLIELYLQVIFYTVGITCLYLVLGKGVNSEIWFKTLLPVVSSCYWYVTAYFGMCLFVPMMNTYLEQKNKVILLRNLLCVFLVISVLPTLFNVDPFRLNRGYSMIWLCILYLVGGFIRKYDINKLFSAKKAILYYGCAIAMTWITKLSLEMLTLDLLGKPKYGNILVKYTSPTIVLAGIFLFIFFVNLRITSEKCLKVIRGLAPASFGVYLIHLQPLVWRKVVLGFAVPFTKSSCIMMILKVLVVAVVSYLIFSCIDIVRIKLFEHFNVKAKAKKLSGYLEYRISRLELL